MDNPTEPAYGEVEEAGGVPGEGVEGDAGAAARMIEAGTGDE